MKTVSPKIPDYQKFPYETTFCYALCFVKTTCFLSFDKKLIVSSSPSTVLPFILFRTEIPMSDQTFYCVYGFLNQDQEYKE